MDDKCVILEVFKEHITDVNFMTVIEDLYKNEASYKIKLQSSVGN